MKEDQKRRIVTEEIGNIYEQLVINCKKTCGAGYNKWGEDLLAMCVEMFLEKKTDYIYKVYTDGKLENFLTFMMSFQLKSSTTRFFHRYRKHMANNRELYDNLSVDQDRVARNTAFEDEQSEVYTCMKKVIDKLNPYEKMLVNEIMIEGARYNTTSEKYKINYHSLKGDYKKVQMKIKKLCKHLI